MSTIANAPQLPAEQHSLAGIDVQRLLDFLEHMPERFTPVVQPDPEGPFAYYIVNYLVDDELRSKVQVFEPDFALNLRKLATAFSLRPPLGGDGQ